VDAPKLMNRPKLERVTLTAYLKLALCKIGALSNIGFLNHTCA